MAFSLSPWTWSDVMNVIRKTLQPSRLSTYLPDASPYTTDTIAADTPTKLLIPTTQKYIQDFDLDLVNERYKLSTAGITNRNFEITAAVSISSSQSSFDLKVQMYKNGIAEPGVGIERWIGTGSDKGAFPIVGSFDLSTND